MVAVDHVRAWWLAAALADACGVRAPRVAPGVPEGAEVARYHPRSRTIVVCRGDADLASAIVHEFQHHLDELAGASTGGEPRGRHGAAFYARLDRLVEFAAALPAFEGEPLLAADRCGPLRR